MGRKWTQDDVLAYKMKIIHEDLETFFGVTDLPPSIAENDPLTAQNIARITNAWTSRLRFYTDGVAKSHMPDNREASTLGFVRDLFTPLRYNYITQELQRSVVLRTPLRYLASPGRPPQVDACLMDETDTILLVVKVDSRWRGSDPEPRLISEAIAAFHNDNIMNAKHLGTDPLTSKVMPGIIMDGTMPTFFKIPITTELVTAVESGEPPQQETIVHAYHPEVPRPGEGMKPLDNRSIILSCFEAFKKFF
jgi:hypothetical protein